MALHESIIERLKSQHISLLQITKDMDEKTMREKPEGKWSVYENFVHLAVYQPRFVHRVTDILSGNNPVFEPYIAENDALFQEYMQLGYMDVWMRLLERRDDLIQSIIHLKSEELAKVGYHAKYGKMTLLEWIEFFLLHEAHHIYNIFMLKKQLHHFPHSA